MATFANTVELKNQTNRILRKVQRGPVIITRRGHPCAALVALEEDSIEEFLWEFSSRVRRKVARGLKDLRQGRVISASEFARRYGVR